MRYITEEGEQAARKFNYKGGDLSISYRYIWSPFSDRVVEVIPRTWAPNKGGGLQSGHRYAPLKGR